MATATRTTPATAPFTTETHEFKIDGTTCRVGFSYRRGSLTPVLLLHGFGSSKEDYTDFTLNPAFADRAFIAYDAPGCAQSQCSDPDKLSIPFLVQTAEVVLSFLEIDRFHLVGHSMGALTTLELAHKHPTRVLSFVNIKGNLASEDRFLSRQIFDYPETDTGVFFDEFIERTARAPLRGSALYAATLRTKAQATSIRPIFESMVKLSDQGRLLDKFLSLPCPRVFMFGQEYNWLSYIPILEAASGINLAEIQDAGHFPMYPNPVAMWQKIQEAIIMGEAI